MEQSELAQLRSLCEHERYKARQKQKKEDYRKVAKRKAIMSTLPDNERVKQSLLTAAYHAKHVILRNSIVPERNQRIGAFVTALRRELKDIMLIHQPITTMLCEKTNWADILEVNNSNGWRCIDKDLEAIIESAYLDFVSNKAHNIEAELKELENSVYDSHSFISSAEKINKEADQIMAGFDELAEEMAEN